MADASKPATAKAAAAPTVTVPADALESFARALLEALRMPADRARDVAQILVEGDLMGHDTHGLAQLAPYLKEIDTGSMRVTGEPQVLSDRGAAITWDGQRLPGPWLVLRAMDLAFERAAQYGTASVAIRRSHHIACLAAYLPRATERGLMMTLYSSGPTGASVAPYGGTRAVFSPDPLAVGIPTGGDPVLVDVSTSITSNAFTREHHRDGRRLPQPWLLDAQGQVTDDPAVLFSEPKGTILPLGGADAGHKGYGLALMVEALTAGLAGHGRADPIEGWGASVMLQVLDPAAFGGLAPFQFQLDHLVKACQDNPPRAGFQQVRLPGERALQMKRRQLDSGVVLKTAILDALRPWADRFGIAMPAGH